MFYLDKITLGSGQLVRSGCNNLIVCCIVSNEYPQHRIWKIDIGGKGLFSGHLLHPFLHVRFGTYPIWKQKQMLENSFKETDSESCGFGILQTLEIWYYKEKLTDWDYNFLKWIVFYHWNDNIDSKVT